MIGVVYIRERVEMYDRELKQSIVFVQLQSELPTSCSSKPFAILVQKGTSALLPRLTLH